MMNLQAYLGGCASVYPALYYSFCYIFMGTTSTADDVQTVFSVYHCI